METASFAVLNMNHLKSKLNCQRETKNIDDSPMVLAPNLRTACLHCGVVIELVLAHLGRKVAKVGKL